MIWKCSGNGSMEDEDADMKDGSKISESEMHFRCALKILLSGPYDANNFPLYMPLPASAGLDTDAAAPAARQAPWLRCGDS